MLFVFGVVALMCALNFAATMPADNDSKHPIFIPGKCAKNQLSYPGPNKSDPWQCDCAPEYIYNKADDTCHAAHERGPCPVGQIFVLLDINKNEELKPRCIRNRCKEGQVRFRMQCWELYKEGGPCAKKNGGNDGVLKINPLTMMPDCMVSDDRGLCLTCNVKGKSTCYPGRKNRVKGCRPKYEFDEE